MSDINVTVTPPAQINVALSGTQGISGPPILLVAFELTALEDGAQVITLPKAVESDTWRLLCINGVRQAAAAYSVAGTVLTLPADLSVLAGDLISFDYSPIP